MAKRKSKGRKGTGGSHVSNGMSNRNGTNGGSGAKALGALNNGLGLPFLSRLTPQQIAVITAILANALSVESILVDKDKTVQIILEGSLRRKTKMDKLLAEMSELSIGDLLDSISFLSK